jgi:hypothetical protein
LTDREGQKLQQIVRRGSTSSAHYRRAMMLLASTGRKASNALESIRWSKQ